MLKELKEEVLAANLLLPEHGLVTFTWGNVSGIDRGSGLVVIKPSGVPYERLSAEDMVVIDMDGRVVEGSLRPSSDTPTHLELYKASEAIGGVVHTHSRWATVFAQAGRDIPALGTTHADYFFGPIVCTRDMTKEEIEGPYEKMTGLVIVETFAESRPEEVPGVLVRSHGPFAWGADAHEAVHNAVVMEEVAFMCWHSELMNPEQKQMDARLLRRHFMRKHGEGAYYGQTAGK